MFLLTSRGQFPTGYQYRDADIDLIVPNVTQWAKLEIGMSPDDVRRLLGRPLEGEDSTKPDNLRHQYFEEYIQLGYSIPDATSAARERVEFDLTCGIKFIETWHYGWLKFGDGDLFWQHFAVSFVDDNVFGFSDPFGGGQSAVGNGIETRLSHDGRPTTPRLLTPYTDARFTHSPFLLDFRWLPSCGEYPLSYVIELTGCDYEYDVESGNATRIWLDEPKSVWPTKTPHLAANAPGGGRYRWRVKAKNRLGESDWSEHREFEF